jgi:hypothetical protein
MAKPWRCRVRLHRWQAPSRGQRPVAPRMPRLKLAALRVGRLICYVGPPAGLRLLPR